MNKLPDTSLSAYKALTPEKLAKDYSDIILALKRIKEGNYENISHALGWHDINKCSRRLCELERMQIVYKPGRKTLTSRNRSAYTYKLVESSEVSAKAEKQMKGESVADYSRKLIQKELF